MAETTASLKLTHEGAVKALQAGIAKANEMKQPQCISIVDAGGHLLAFVRMDGAFHMSLETALRKARTAACYGQPTGGLEAGIDMKLAVGTDGQRINLPGGLPIVVDGHCIGGVGVGSGTGEQDRQVAAAAI
ncbi:MAG: heme-binding protein, partial [Alphaproteobacteria bacterium]